MKVDRRSSGCNTRDDSRRLFSIGLRLDFGPRFSGVRGSGIPLPRSPPPVSQQRGVQILGFWIGLGGVVKSARNRRQTSPKRKNNTKRIHISPEGLRTTLTNK